MSNKKQTAVDWLVEQIKKDINLRLRGFDIDKALEQAKEMEKQQIIEGFKKGLEYWNGDEWKLIDIKQYYKQTYENRD